MADIMMRSSYFDFEEERSSGWSDSSSIWKEGWGCSCKVTDLKLEERAVVSGGLSSTLSLSLQPITINSGLLEFRVSLFVAKRRSGFLARKSKIFWKSEIWNISFEMSYGQGVWLQYCPIGGHLNFFAKYVACKIVNMSTTGLLCCQWRWGWRVVVKLFCRYIGG